MRDRERERARESVVVVLVLVLQSLHKQKSNGMNAPTVKSKGRM